MHHESTAPDGAGIRTICLSDLHLGDKGSLLTDLDPETGEVRPDRLSPMAQALVRTVRELARSGGATRKPVLLLNGDVLELALARVDQAAMVFERFLGALVAGEGLHAGDREGASGAGGQAESPFEEIILVPGNHDHHLWESARETQYVHHLRTLEPSARLPPQRHVTPVLFQRSDQMISSYLLSNLRWSADPLRRVRVAYPTWGQVAAGRSALFHHGHYTEGIYHLVSTLRGFLVDAAPPGALEELEAENFAWIDFFWSALGRSGRAGQTVASVYEHLGDERHFDRLLRQLCRRLAERYDLPGWGEWMEAKILYWVLRRVVRAVRKRERSSAATLSEASKAGVEAYLRLLAADPTEDVLGAVGAEGGVAGGAARATRRQ